MKPLSGTTGRRQPRRGRASTPGARSVPALYGTLTAGLVAVVMVVASVVAPAAPPSIAELGPSARERIEEARENQGIGPGEGGPSSCAPDDVACIESERERSADGRGSRSDLPPQLQVAAGRRCFGDPPRQTEDPHSPPCVFEIFKGDNGGATAPGVTATEIRVAVAVPPPNYDSWARAVVEGLVAHFNLRYEFYGRRITPVFVEAYPQDDSKANTAASEDLLETKSFAVSSTLNFATNTVIHRQLARERVISVVSRPPGFDSDAVIDGFTWLVDPPLDVRLGAGSAFACRALNGRPASHAGPEYSGTQRKFAIVVLTEKSGARPDEGSLREGLNGCGAEFEVFDLPFVASTNEVDALMLQLRSEGFTTVLTVSSAFTLALHFGATRVGYFPEWLDLGLWGAHGEVIWAGNGQRFTASQASHAFGLTPDVRVRPDAEVPAIWALREGDGSVGATQMYVEPWYQSLLVLASGIQGAGPDLTPETFAEALRTTAFSNPGPGAPPYWQQGIGFGLGDAVFHDDYAVWWWNENAPSQTSDSSSGRGSFCYLDRGGRFAADTFPTNADARLFSSSEPCR